MTDEENIDGGFDFRTARFDGPYPSEGAMAELGRATLAASRVDAEVALVLVGRGRRRRGGR